MALPLAMTILNGGQSNMYAYDTGVPVPVPYPGGWPANAPPPGAAWSEVTFNRVTGQFVRYIPGVVSYFGGPTQFWGVEAPIALAKRGSGFSTYIDKYAIGGVGMAVNRGQPGADPYGNDFSPWSSGRGFDGMIASFLGFASALAPYVTVVFDEFYGIYNESDAKDWASASSLAHDLPYFISELRRRLNAPNMKCIFARTKLTLGSVGGPLPYVDIVRAAQEGVRSISRCDWVNTDDIASGGTPGHYDDIVTLGQRMYAAAAAL